MDDMDGIDESVEFPRKWDFQGNVNSIGLSPYSEIMSRTETGG